MRIVGAKMPEMVLTMYGDNAEPKLLIADTIAMHIERVAMVAWSEARHVLAGVKQENAKPISAPPIKMSGSEPPI